MENEKEIDNLLKESRMALEKNKKIEEEKNQVELNATIRSSTIKLKKEKMGSTEKKEMDNKRKEIDTRVFSSKRRIEELKAKIWQRTDSMFFDKKRDFLKLIEDNYGTKEDVEITDNGSFNPISIIDP